MLLGNDFLPFHSNYTIFWRFCQVSIYFKVFSLVVLTPTRTVRLMVHFDKPLRLCSGQAQYKRQAHHAAHDEACGGRPFLRRGRGEPYLLSSGEG